jgi:hypothetical protein
MGTVTLKCNYCGRPCLENAIVSANPDQESERKWFVMCPQCCTQVETCVMCQEANKCDFETNSDPSPKQVQQTIRQGQMVMQTIVQNPDRVEKTCKNGCKCWNDEFGCLKQNGTCGNYTEVMPKC